MLKNDLFFKSIKGETVQRPPVWMMRRRWYLPEFIVLRDKYDFTRCQTPELAAEITVQPIRRISSMMLCSRIS
jgi:uroporphyrinogen decarboxylase